MEKNGDVGKVAVVLGIVGTLIGYGVWVGRISQKVTTIETKQEKLEGRIDEKLDVITASIYDTNIKLEGVGKDVQYLRERNQ